VHGIPCELLRSPPAWRPGPRSTVRILPGFLIRINFGNHTTCAGLHLGKGLQSSRHAN
jgi:hypothetical protein